MTLLAMHETSSSSGQPPGEADNGRLAGHVVNGTLANGRSAEQRGIDIPMPFGWFAMCYSDELAVVAVQPLHYFERELAVWRGADGVARVLDAYCPHLGAHLGYGGKVDGNDLQGPRKPIAEFFILFSRIVIYFGVQTVGNRILAG